MCFPLDLLVARKSGDDGEVLVRAVEDGVTLRRPAQAVDRLTALNNLRAHHTATRPGLDLTVFSSSCESSFITPLDADDGGLVSL
jgi:hypothetical protein